MLRTADLNYDLPEAMIATSPALPRDSARLMVVSRTDRSRVEHRHVRDLPEILRSRDLLVVNSTRVLPARFTGVREDSGGRVQGLYLGPVPRGHGGTGGGSERMRWGVMVKSRRQAPGVRVRLDDRAGRPSGVSLVLIERHADEQGAWVAEVVDEGGGGSDEEILGRVGLTPLPPYILQARKHRLGRGGLAIDDEADRAAYQTVFAEQPEAARRHGLEAHATTPGSVAAPTAGLHLTPELLERLEEGGIGRAEVVLHVGTGTFKPVETEYVEQHPMHAEWCRLPAETGRAMLRTKAKGGRIVAVGTTSARTIESFEADELERGGAKETRLLITPGHAWKHADVLMTNFHLPGSTLMAMVAAFLGDDADAVERLKGLYAVAMREGAGGYRFYSYGDAMIVLP